MFHKYNLYDLNHNFKLNRIFQIFNISILNEKFNSFKINNKSKINDKYKYYKIYNNFKIN